MQSFAVLTRRWRWLAGGVAIVLPLAGAWWLGNRGDPTLRKHAFNRPPVDIVFTSRSTAASLQAAAPDGAEYVYPGKRLWQSPEGRLRLLSATGAVYELTWNKPLPDGGLLIDVMSPAITADAKKVIFCGRRNDDHGHFRLYEVGLDGSGLRPLIPEASDPGCTTPPPMRWRTASQREVMSESERRKVDYDDVDPAPLPDGRVAFISSRTPDLGRDHARRATNLWMRESDGRMHPLSSNRNNDRWPFLTCTGQLIFSHWSRNREVVAGDRSAIVPWSPGCNALTAPTDAWMAALVEPAGNRFGHFVKASWPVWRPRMLFNGRMICMTRRIEQTEESSTPRAPLCTAQVEPGLIANAPSAMASGDRLPQQADLSIRSGALRNDRGDSLESATPAPCPPSYIVLAGRPLSGNQAQTRATEGSWGLYLAGDDWSETHDARPVQGKLLFDDPELVDAEPVAVYQRTVVEMDADVPRVQVENDPVRLLDGTLDRGPAAYVDNAGLFMQQNEEAPGQTTDRGEGPIFAPPPPQSIERVRIYAAERDRFDDPLQPRINGGFRPLLDVPLTDTGRSAAWIPIQQPTVLAGFDADGRVAQWTTGPKDSQGRSARFLAYAGDHYSGGKSGGITMCLGCHPGHSGIGYRRGNREHRER